MNAPRGLRKKARSDRKERDKYCILKSIVCFYFAFLSCFADHLNVNASRENSAQTARMRRLI